MKKRNKTALTLGAALLTVVLMSTACSNQQTTGSSPSPTSSASASSAPETTNPSPSASAETISGTGKYVGMQDNHSVEITTAEGPTAFQISPEVAEKIGEWEENTSVKFQYTVEKLETDNGSVEQKTIISIEKE
jgi:ABC-type oligopeptide transport system substrate-binding subunit